MKRTFFIALCITCFSSTIVAASQDSEMDRVKAIMAESHQIQTQQQASSVAQEPAPKPSSGFFQSFFNSNDGAEQQLTTVAGQSQQNAPNLKQSVLAFQQETNQQIENLSQNQTALQEKLSEVSQAVNMLNQELVQLNESTLDKKAVGQGPELPKLSTVMPLSETIQADMRARTTQYALYVILLLLVIIILLMLIPRRSAYRLAPVTECGAMPATEQDDPENDTQDEYDFMNSHEAIPAKLDLARAYIAMEKYEAAKKVLLEVKKTGNATQQNEALAMLSKIAH